jgi:hypothetical protein
LCQRGCHAHTLSATAKAGKRDHRSDWARKTHNLSDDVQLTWLVRERNFVLELMKRIPLAVLLGLLFCLGFQDTHAQIPRRTSYVLLEGSSFLDQCLICGRPDIYLPLRGTFELVLVQPTAPYTKYAIQNINFTAGAGTSMERHLTGDGTYVRFEEFAVLQDMNLAVQIKDSYTIAPPTLRM